MRRSSFVLAVGLLCGLTSVACKQGLGQRCEQDSDCESGLCQGADMVSAAGGHCTTGDNPIPTFDAAVPTDATGSDASDALMSDAVEAGGDGATPDASEARSDAPISETGSEAGDATGADATGADASGADGSDAADASSDASVEAATGG